MFIIKNKQADVFKALALKKFEDEMVVHVKEFFPTHFMAIGETSTRNSIQYAYSQAKKYGFNSQRNVCLYLNSMIAFGSNFDKDPQYRWAQSILLDNTINNAMTRIDKVSETAEEIFDQIAGPDQIYLNAAYQNMHDNYKDIFQDASGENFRDTLECLRIIFPEKYEVVGMPDLQVLVKYGIKYAGYYGIRVESNILVYIVFMFLFGSGFDTDPQFSWAEKILSDNFLEENKKMELICQYGTDCMARFLLKENY